MSPPISPNPKPTATEPSSGSGAPSPSQAPGIEQEPANQETLSPSRVVGDGRTPLVRTRPRPSASPTAQVFDMASNDSVEDEAAITPAKKKRSTHGGILMCATRWSTRECNIVDCPHQHSRPGADPAPSPIRVPSTPAIVNDAGGTSGLNSSSWGIIPSQATPVPVPEDPTPKMEAYHLEMASRIQLFETKARETSAGVRADSQTHVMHLQAE